MKELLQDATETTVFQASLLKACSCGQLEIVSELLQRMNRPGQTESDRIEETLCQSLALDIVAGNGNLEIVKKLYETNSDLLAHEHPGSYRPAIPVVRASNAGHREVTRYLYEKTPPIVLMHDEGYWARCLLFDAIFYGFLGKSFEYLKLCTFSYSYVVSFRFSIFYLMYLLDSYFKLTSVKDLI